MLADEPTDKVEVEALGALGDVRVRELCEAQQEDLARGGRARSTRSTTTPSSPIRSLRISRSRSSTSRPCWRRARSPSGWRSASRLMESEISVLQVEKRIRTRVKRQMEKTQREYYLNEQMKAIQKELGDEDGKDDLAELEERIKTTKLSKEARDKATAELKKLRQMSPMSAEATVVRNYLDWLLVDSVEQALQGQEGPQRRRGGARQRAFRPREGQGAHRRISRGAEPRQQADRARSSASSARPASARPRSASRSPRRPAANSCACRSAACATRPRSAATGAPISAPCPARSSSRCARPRRPTRCSCSMRSTRWAWTSAAIRRRRCSRCSIRSRTTTFNDHYLEVDYDLSNVMFVTTANTLNIPAPLMDRMEIIRIAGYTEDEKVEIARRHLIPAAIEEAWPRSDE